MAAPATMVLAKLLIPETGTPLTLGTVRMEIEKTSSNVIDAAASGAADGLRLALNIGAMLLAFIALIALVDGPLTWLGEIRSEEHTSELQSLMRISYAVFCLKKKNHKHKQETINIT